MKSYLMVLVCLLSLAGRSGISGHAAHPATSSSDGGVPIDSINHISPDRTHNFTIGSANSTVTITSVPNGIDLAVEPAVETINSILPDSSGNFSITAGTGVVITPGTNSFSIAAPGGSSGIGAITADAGGFITGTNVTLSGGSTGLTTDAISATQINLTGTLDVDNGGTGAVTLTGVLIGNGTSAVTGNAITQHDVLIGGASNAITSLSPSTSGFVMTSNGTGADPSFQAVSASGAVTSVTGNSGGAETPSSGNFNIVGTGSVTVAGSANTETVQLTGLTNHAVLVGAGTATITKVGPSSTSGQILQSAGAAADPAFSTATYPSTTTVNNILYSSSANTVAEITTANEGVLITSSAGVPSWLANSGVSGYVLTSSIGAPPSWEPLTEGVSLYVVDSQGNAGYTTIQSAIDAAVTAGADATTPQTVWIWPGTYNENLILHPYVNLAAASDPTVSSGVIVVGNAVYPDPLTGSLSITNIEFINPIGLPAISFQSTQASTVILNAVYCNSGHWTALECTGSGMDITYINGYIESLNDANAINLTAGLLKIVSSRIEFHDSVYQSVVSGGAVLEFFSSIVNDAYTVGTGSSISVFNSVMGLTSVGFSPIFLDSGATATVVNSALGSSGFIVGGSGTLNYSAVTSLIGTGFDSNLTAVRLPQITVPAASSTATSGFGGTLTAGSPVLNSLGYEILLNICASVSSSTGATITLGVGPTNPPATNTVVSSFTVAAATKFNFTAIVPRGYYVLVDTTGTITVDSITTQACPL